MLKSSSSRLRHLVIIGIVVSCNCASEKRDPHPQKGSIEGSAVDSVVAKSDVLLDTGQAEFSISIEGYKATPLGKAVYDADTTKIEELIREGVSVEKCLTDETYIFDILYAAFVLNKVRIVHYALRKQYYTDVNEVYTEEAETPLTLACNLINNTEALEVSRLLINLGANVNGGGESGGEQTKYPLIIAVSRNNVELTKLLLDHGANKTVKNRYGETPQNIAQKKGYAEVEQLLASNY